MYYQGDFDVGGVARRADDVKIALPEFAVAPMAGVFPAPNRSHVIALERSTQLADVLCGKTGERHGQIEPERDIPTPVVLKSVDKLVDFRAALAQHNIRVRQSRGIDGSVPV